MYYIYALVDPRTNLPFYIGKGKKENNRHLDHFKESIEVNSNRHKVFKIKHLQKLGLEIPIRVLVDNLEDEDNAYEIETTYIQQYGRKNIDKGGILANILLDSRNPPSAKGKTQSEEHKAKRVASRKKTIAERGLPERSLEYKKSVSERMKGSKNPFYGKTHSDEFKKEQSQMMKGNQFNAKVYEFISPTGQIYIVNGFAKFCREHNLSVGTLEKGMYRGMWPTKGSAAGWRVTQNPTKLMGWLGLDEKVEEVVAE